MSALVNLLNNPATRFVVGLSQNRLLPAACIVTGLAGTALQYRRAQKQETTLEHLVEFIDLKAGNAKEYCFGVLQAVAVAERNGMVFYSLEAEEERLVSDELKGFLRDLVGKIKKRAERGAFGTVWFNQANELGKAVTDRATQIQGQLGRVVENERTDYVTPALEAAKALQKAQPGQMPELVTTFMDKAKVQLHRGYGCLTPVGSLLYLLNKGNPQTIKWELYLKTGPDVSSVEAIRKGFHIQPINAWTPAIAGLITAVALIGLRWLPVGKLSSLSTA